MVVRVTLMLRENKCNLIDLKKTVCYVCSVLHTYVNLKKILVRRMRSSGEKSRGTKKKKG